MDPSRDFLTTDGKLLYKLFYLVSEFSTRIPQISSQEQEVLDAAEEPVVVYAVVVSTLSLLSIVYQYLLGYILEGGTAAYSSGSLNFQETFVSLLLFEGSYVWIFFRDVAGKRTVYPRKWSKKDGTIRVRYEPRFKPHREKLPDGTTVELICLALGGYDSHSEAEIVCQIGGYYYMSDEGRIQLKDGSYFTIPPMLEQEQSLCGKDKAKWVEARAKEVFREFQLINNAIILPSETNAVGVRDVIQHVASEKFSLDALLEDDGAHPFDWEFADNLWPVGEGLEGIVTSPSSADLNFVDNLVAVGEGSEGTPASSSDAEQVVLRMERPQSVDLESLDAGSLAKLEISIQKLKKQLEAERNQRISEHEQHLQREKQLEERILQLEREKEEGNSKLQLEDEILRSFLC